MKHICCLLFILIPAIGFSQFGTLDITNEISPSNGNNSLNTLSQSVSARFPISHDKAKRFSLGLHYKNLLTGNNTSVIDNLWLHSVGVSLTYTDRINDQTIMSITAQPSIWCDMESISGDDVRFNAMVHFITKKSETFSLGWGLAYSYQFFGNQIIPIIDVRFKKNTVHWRIGGALPLRPRIEYVFNKNTSIGFKMEGNYYSYRLSPQLNSQYLFYRQWDAGLFLDQRISGKWYFTASSGYAFNRSLQIFDKDQTLPLTIFGGKLDKKFTPAYSNQSTGFVFKIGVQLRLFSIE